MENKDKETLDIELQVGHDNYKISAHVEFGDNELEHKVTIEVGAESPSGTTPLSTVYSGPMTFVNVIINHLVESIFESKLRDLVSPLRREMSKKAE